MKFILSQHCRLAMADGQLRNRVLGSYLERPLGGDPLAEEASLPGLPYSLKGGVSSLPSV